MAAVSLADLKAHLNLDPTDSSSDVELAVTLDAAEDVVAGLIGPLGSRTVTEVHYGVNSDVIALRQVPVAAVSAVAARTYGTWYDRPTGYTETEPASGVMRVATGGRFQGDIKVTYQAGDSAVPAAVQLALLIVAAHLWQTQLGNTAAASVLSQESAGFQPGSGFAIPSRARELLESYMTRVPGIA